MEQKNENHGGNPVNVNQLIGNIYNTSQAEKQRDATQQKLLDVVRKEVSDRLDQSLHHVVNAALINLGKELQPDRVRSPWQMEMRSKARSPQLLPPETTIAEVFDNAEISRKLLILGEPGSGKTTTLLELAKSLVERAENSATQPVPVLLSLSSWKPIKPTKVNPSNEAQPFLSWLLSEIKLKYGLNSKLSQKWLAENELLLLLDGLDEVKPEHQQACAKAINHWLTADLEHQPAGLVVCCRIEEYEQVVRHCLFLNGAIALQPLTESQIADYLHQFGLASVWQSAQASDSLQALLQKPLFLSVFGFVASEGLFDGAAWQQRTTEAAQQEYLWDQYWEAAMQRELMPARDREQGLKSKTYDIKEPPSRKALRRALVFAAKGMSQDSLTELLIEEMQPRWLISERQCFNYRLLSGLLCGAMCGLVSGLFLGIEGSLPSIRRSSSNLDVPFFPAWLLALLLGVGMGSAGLSPNKSLIINAIPRKVYFPRLLDLFKEILFEPISISWEFFSAILQVLIMLSVMGIGILGFGNGLLFTVLTLGASTLGGLLFTLTLDDEDNRLETVCANQVIKENFRSIIYLFFIGFIFRFLFVSLFGLGQNEAQELSPIQELIAFFFSLSATGVFILFGGLTYAQHLALRLVMWWNGYAPPRYDRLLDYATERLLLQRIGGRYRFMHKLLQEYFAAMPLEE